MISIPRWILYGLGAFFSAYHVVLGVYTLATPSMPGAVILALALYAVATTLSLWPTPARRIPQWLAGFNVAVSIAAIILVESVLDPTADNGYATWYVAAVGTLMTITAARRRLIAAWIGSGALVVLTVMWAGPGALGALGVIGSAVWVATAHMLTRALASAARETRDFWQAEREATNWQAGQDAHVFEGQARLAQTSRLAASMLERIATTSGDLSEAERAECRRLEAGIRDEIRGRMLLSDDVRAAVQSARERGATVTVLDEGGIDDLSIADRARVLNTLAHAVAESRADRIIIRTAVPESAAAITVVGLIEADPASGDDDVDVELWLEIPRAASPVPVAGRT